MKKVMVAPSLLACKEGQERFQIELLTSAGASWIHFDVMDGKFVPNTALTLEKCQEIASFSSLPIDVHVMVFDPQKYVEPFVKAGAKVFTFHYEALNNDEERRALLKFIKAHHIKAGISIKPATKVEVLWPLLKDADLVLVMSVEPGKGGQAFLPSATKKIQSLKAKKEEQNLSFLIEVDGGINEETASLVKEAGVDVLVAGSYLFHKEDTIERVKKIKGE